MTKGRDIRAAVCVMTALVMAFLLLPAIQPVSAVSVLKVSANVANDSTVKLSWGSQKKAVKKVVKWKVRAVSLDDEGNPGSYKLVKTLKKGKKGYTIKKLKADTAYDLQVFGYVKKKGKLKLAYRGENEVFTGIVTPEWDEYANSDYKYGTDMIETAFYSSGNGLAVSGYEIFRREAAGADDSWQMIADLDKSAGKGKSEIVYQDNTVSPGARYLYKVRSYIDRSGERRYSGYSEELAMAAVNQIGAYTYSEKSRTKDEIVICLNSEQFNGDTRFRANDTFSLDGSPDDDDLVRIAQFSRDGSVWQDLKEQSEEDEMANKDPVENINFVVLEGGGTLWLRFIPVDADEDTDLVTDGKTFDADNISYNGLPSDFHLGMDENGAGIGSAVMNSELIH